MTTACDCSTPPFRADRFEATELGMDDRYAEIAIETCRTCGRPWLRYRIEDEFRSRSGRWWRVPVPPSERDGMTAANARAFLERQRWGFLGGSHFESSGREWTGEIHVW